MLSVNGKQNSLTGETNKRNLTWLLGVDVWARGHFGCQTFGHYFIQTRHSASGSKIL